MNCMLMHPPSCNKNIGGLGFPARQQGDHSTMSVSLSNITTGDSNVADYQDCGLSPALLNGGETKWESNFEVSCPHARDKAKMRYNEKKKTRM